MSVPSEATCPKCGSTDILRRYYAKGATIEAKRTDYNRSAPLPRWVGTHDGWKYWTTRELIHQHCRCCQFDWADAPIKKPKEAAVSE